MKKLILVSALFMVLVAGCKTAKNIVVKEEAVTVVNASEFDVAYKYYVIFGSFKELNNAINFSDKLITKGFSAPVLLKTELGLYRVSVFSTDSESQAREKISAYRDMYPEFSDMWLLIKI